MAPAPGTGAPDRPLGRRAAGRSAPHEMLRYSAFPLHVGMRQYWRDLDSLEAWTRSDPHRTWWWDLLRDSGGTGSWHETHPVHGGMEAVHDDVRQPRAWRPSRPGGRRSVSSPARAAVPVTGHHHPDRSSRKPNSAEPTGQRARGAREGPASGSTGPRPLVTSGPGTATRRGSGRLCCCAEHPEFLGRGH
ncbi:monooxygenase family protein [Geodermatophilus sp. DSM 44513]|uniref:monooxygenase family protein n=1 Tax=Geodermatophilus sp. DSM 44513 TaxID=1528104 RepID=UPI0037BFB8EC